jgi:predicted nucleic acid-binding protein
MQSAVFDSFAVLAWFKGEPGGSSVAALLTDVADGVLWGGICAVNLGEVYYVVTREHGPEQAEELLENLLHLPWHVLPVSNELVWAAARLKARFPISYADAFALACAEEHDADLITDDPELREAPHGVTVRWETE